MKKIINLITVTLLAVNASAQQPPTGVGTGVIPATPFNMTKAWFRGGNNAAGAGATDNIFGTMWNSPIYTKTAGFTRTRLNGDFTANINGVAQNVSGYMGLSYNPGAGSVFDVESPRSMLHIDGPNNTPFGGDWRSWMRTGTYYRENSDAMYVGMKPEAGTNRSDAVVNWSDDAGTAGGPDALRFIFTSTSTGNGNNNLNPRAASGLNGYEYLRMMPYPYTTNLTNSQGTPVGHIGVGPLFDNTAAKSPKSKLHLHAEDKLENYIQISNEVSNSNTPNSLSHNDGLRVGIHSNKNYPADNLANGHAYMYNQENRSLLFSTNHEAPTVQGVSSNVVNDFERMRISSNTTPTFINNSTSFGNYNPGSLPNDLTRVSISHDPTTPVNRPLALLHLGYNTGSLLNPLNTDGWRSWMDVGTFVSRGTDNMYIGLKPEGGAFNDRQDAVISFGDNYTNTFPGITSAPDKLRIIFTSPASGQTNSGPGAMSTADGLEFVRYVPFHNTNLGVNDPRTGFGDFENLLPVGTINPGNTIEINSIMNGFNAAANTNVTGSYVGSTGASGLRFRDLTSQSLVSTDSVLTLNKIDVNKVLSVDSLGNVILINNSGGGSGLTLGNICSDSIKNPLLNNWEIPLNGHNFVFSGDSSGTDRVGIGTNCFPANKLEIDNSTPNTSGLRLTRLPNTSVVSGNTPNKVLSVDANGDVILVNDNIGAGTFAGAQNGTSNVVTATNPTGKVEFGNAVGAAQAALLNDRQVPMNNKTVLFNGQGTVKIGQNAAVANPAGIIPTFEVNNSSNTNNNVGLYVRDNGGNGVVNRQAVKIQANINTSDNATSILDVEHSNPATNQYSTVGSWLMRVKGLDWDGNGIGDEGFAMNAWGHSGFYLTTPAEYKIATVGMNAHTNQSAQVNTNTGNYGRRTLMVNNVNPNSQHSWGAEIFCKTNTQTATGVFAVGIAESTNSNAYYHGGTGVYAKGVSNASPSPAMGVYGLGTSGALNASPIAYGVYGEAKSSTTGNYGIFGRAIVSVAAPVNYAGYFNGDVKTTATLWQTSDKNFKTNIEAIKSPLEKLMRLKPSYYDFDLVKGAENGINLPIGKNYGFIAQEVETIFPELVKASLTEGVRDSLTNTFTPPATIKTLNYTGLIGIAVGGIQELNNKQKEILATLDKAGLSDAQVKTNINSFNALAKIKTLNPVSYNFTNANVPQLNFNSHLEYGFVAQQLETVYPELVDTLRVNASYDSLGVVVNPSKVLKTVNYKAMTGLLVRSIQEQQLTIDSLRTNLSKQDSINQAVQQQLAALLSQINACCSNSTIRTTNNATQTALNQLDVELSDKDAVVLNQNVPNPFAEQTTITYNVPSSVGKAQIIFFNNLGQIIQTVDIKTRGKGKVNVFASDLSSGLYNYTLVVDGKVADSKKMVRE